MKRGYFLVCLLAAGLIAAPVYAEHTRFWRQSEFSDFEKGDPQGVAVRSDGKLLPAPHLGEFSDPNLPYLWTLRTDSRGRLYAAGGSDAKVLQFDASGKPTTVFESQELSAQAIAFDNQNNLYVGTSPDGKVYKVTPNGQHSVFFDPKTKYIWALAVDSTGTLFVATGDEGQVFAVAPDGTGKLFYKTDERHARSLTFDDKGNLLIGTDPNGLIVRVQVNRGGAKGPVEPGPSFVLYETEKKEVTSLLTDKTGTIYVAAVGEKGQQPNLPPVQNIVTAQTVSPVTPGATTVVAQGAVPQPRTNVPFLSALSGGAVVIRIASDGSPRTIWTSRDDLVYSMAFSSAGKLLLGTGSNGSIIELDGDDLFSRIAKTASAQVTGLAAGPNGTVYVATANPGKIFTLGAGPEMGGSFESAPFDAKIFAHWGRISWWGENGAAAGKVVLYARSGNTSRPQEDWSAWSGPYTKASGETITCPAGRFVQWKAVFSDSDPGGGTPSVSWVNLAYQPTNIAPAIDDIAIQEPGVRVQGFSGQSGGPGQQMPVALRMPQRTIDGAANSNNSGFTAPRPQRPEVPPQGFEQKGYESVLWAAHDDNDDDLVFTIYYRAEGETNWRLLKDKLDQHYYSWDSNSMPDGAYYLKIVASDSPSNPPDQALSATRESDRFVIDNTPPAVQNLRAEPVTGKNGDVQIHFEADDSHSDLARAEYVVDSGTWDIVYPVGLLTDAPKETYQLDLHNLAPGEHTIAVRVTDNYENVGAAQVTFTVPTP